MRSRLIEIFLVSNMCAFLLITTGCGASHVPAPESFEELRAKDGAFKIEAPSGWKSSSGGNSAIQWATLKKGSVEINVNADVVGSLMMGSPVGTSQTIGGEGDVDLEPVADAHEMRKESMAEQYSNYAEQDPERFRCGLGPGRKSQFTATDLLSKIQGYRATVLSSKKRITIICQCSEANWSTLQPAFDHVIESLDVGR